MRSARGPGASPTRSAPGYPTATFCTTGTLVREHIRREEYALYPAVLRAATKLNPG
jgi:hypothetical protein